MKRTEEFYRYMLAIRREQTAEKYTYWADRFLGWVERSGGFASAPKGALNDFCLELARSGAAPATLHLVAASVRRYVKWLRSKNEAVPEFDEPELRPIVRIVREILTPEALEAYLASADRLREPLRTAVLLLPSTGLRVSELCSLPLDCGRKATVKLRTGTRTVYSVRVTGKGGNERIVPVLEQGVTALRRYLRRGSWRWRHPDKTWLFPSRMSERRGEHMLPHTVEMGLIRMRRKGESFTPHTLRRTYLTTLYRRGVDPVVLAKIAGHTDPRTLFNHYLALDEHDILSAVEEAKEGVA